MCPAKKQEFKEGVPNKRKSLIEPSGKYTIYGLFYKDGPGTNAIAAVASENGEEAVEMLEKSLLENDRSFLRVPLDTIAEDTGYKTSKKGIIYAYDSMNRRILA